MAIARAALASVVAKDVSGAAAFHKRVHMYYYDADGNLSTATKLNDMATAASVAAPGTSHQYICHGLTISAGAKDDGDGTGGQIIQILSGATTVVWEHMWIETIITAAGQYIVPPLHINFPPACPLEFGANAIPYLTAATNTATPVYVDLYCTVERA